MSSPTLTKPRQLRLDFLDLTLNPAVTLITLGVIWGFLIWVAVRPNYAMGEWWW